MSVCLSVRSSNVVQHAISLTVLPLYYFILLLLLVQLLLLLLQVVASCTWDWDWNCLARQSPVVGIIVGSRLQIVANNSINCLLFQIDHMCCCEEVRPVFFNSFSLCTKKKISIKPIGKFDISLLGFYYILSIFNLKSENIQI